MAQFHLDCPFNFVWWLQHKVEVGVQAAPGEQNLMDAVLERVKQQASPKLFQMFAIYALKGWPVKDVVRTLAVRTTQGYLAKHCIAALIKKEIKNLRRKNN